MGNYVYIYISMSTVAIVFGCIALQSNEIYVQKSGD